MMYPANRDEYNRQGRQERQEEKAKAGSPARPNPWRSWRPWRFILLFISPITLLPQFTPADEKPVSYFHDVRPIFNSNCNACHKPDKNKGELDMTTFASLMKGGKHGAAVLPGQPEKSKLVEMVSGDEPDMPKDTDPLHKEQIAVIEKWIKQGAQDDTPAAGTTIVATPVYKVPPVISAMVFSPDGSMLAVSGYHEILLHKPDGSGLLARLIGESPRIEAITFSNDGRELAACGGAPGEFGQVQVWNPGSHKLIKAFNVSTDELYGVSFAPDAKSVAFGGADKVVHRINLEDGKEMLDFKAHADWVLGTFFTLDGKQLVSASRDKALKLIDLETSRFVDDINNPLEACISLARHPKEEKVLYGGDLGTARLYRISDNQGRTAGRNDTNLLTAYERQPGPVSAVAFSPDGNTVALGSTGQIRIYKIDDGAKALFTLSGIQGPVYAIAYKPDGSELAAGGADGSVRLFDPKTGNLIKQFVPVPIENSSTQPSATQPSAEAR